MILHPPARPDHGKLDPARLCIDEEGTCMRRLALLLAVIVATVATGMSSFGSSPGLSSVDTVNAEAYIMMLWPSGSWVATHFAPTRPPAPRRFSTITGWPSVALSFSARMRAIVSEALPGVTPEMKRTVFVG